MCYPLIRTSSRLRASMYISMALVRFFQSSRDCPAGRRRGPEQKGRAFLSPDARPKGDRAFAKPHVVPPSMEQVASFSVPSTPAAQDVSPLPPGFPFWSMRHRAGYPVPEESTRRCSGVIALICRTSASASAATDVTDIKICMNCPPCPGHASPARGKPAAGHHPQADAHTFP